MADIKEIQVGSTTYNIKDETARNGLATKQDAISEVSVDYEENGGSPGASVDFQDGELAFSFENLKMKFSELTAEEKEEIRGPKGDQGDSAVYNPDDPDAPDFEMANTTGQSTTKAMTQKAVTEAVNRLEPSGSNQDFGFADEDGYYIAQFDEGHIKTKEFDSRKAVTDEDIPIADFAIEDENGYDIASFMNGHIKTKKFNSANVRTYKDGSMRIPFSYGVDCIKPYSDTWPTADNLNAYTNQSVYEDNAVLYLPASYDPAGEPTRLIIYCKHGASTVEPESDYVLASTGDGNIFKFLISIGYAVLAADGVPNDYASLIGISERVVGNYIAVQSTRAAYNYVVNKYNIATDGVFVYGWSQGGHYAQNVTDLCGINVLAVAELCPVCSFRYHQWDLISPVTIGGVTWQKSARLNIARLFGFPTVTTDAELEALQFNQLLVNGYDPWTRNVEDQYNGFVQGGSYGSGNLWTLPNGTSLSDITMKKYLKAPLKIWASVNDPTLGTDVMKVFIQAAKNAGCIADMHLLNNGVHNINSLQTAIGTFDFFGTSSPLYPVALEVAKWYRDFGGLPFETTINS